MPLALASGSGLTKFGLFAFYLFVLDLNFTKVAYCRLEVRALAEPLEIMQSRQTYVPEQGIGFAALMLISGAWPIVRILFVLFQIVCVILLFVKGGIFLFETLYLPLVWIGTFSIAFIGIPGLILLIFRKTRLNGAFLVLICSTFQLACFWLYSLILTKIYAGLLWTVIGVLSVVGVIPIALIATVVRGVYDETLQLLLLGGGFFAFYLPGRLVMGKFQIDVQRARLERSRARHSEDDEDESEDREE